MAHTALPPEARRYTALDSEVVTDQTAVFSPRLNALCSPKGVFKGTREEWLEAAALIMGAWLNEALRRRTSPATTERKMQAN